MSTIDSQFVSRHYGYSWYRRTLMHSVWAALPLLAACAADSDPSEPGQADAVNESTEDELPVEHTLASLTVRGVSMRFIQTTPDNAVLLTRGTTGDDPLADPQVRGMNMVQVYEHFAGEQAPAALRVLPAAQRVLTLGGSSDEAVARKGHDKHTNEAFVAEYCAGTHDVCLTDVYWDDVYYAGRDQFIDGAINLISGDGVAVRVREERPVLGWRTITYFKVARGEHWTWHSTSNGAYARRMTLDVEDRLSDLSQKLS